MQIRGEKLVYLAQLVAGCGQDPDFCLGQNLLQSRFDFPIVLNWFSKHRQLRLALSKPFAGIFLDSNLLKVAKSGQTGVAVAHSEVTGQPISIAI